MVYRSGTTLPRRAASAGARRTRPILRVAGRATRAAQSLADTVVDGNYAEWDNHVGEEEAEDSEYQQWVDVPFWFDEAVVDAEAALHNPIQYD